VQGLSVSRRNLLKNFTFFLATYSTGAASSAYVLAFELSRYPGVSNRHLELRLVGQMASISKTSTAADLSRRSLWQSLHLLKKKIKRLSLHLQKERSAVGFNLNDKVRMLIQGNPWLCVFCFKLDVSHSTIPNCKRASSLRVSRKNRGEAQGSGTSQRASNRSCVRGP